MNSRSASTTTAVTVVPRSRAVASAAAHRSSGMRIARGVVTLACRPDADGGAVPVLAEVDGATLGHSCLMLPRIYGVKGESA